MLLDLFSEANRAPAEVKVEINGEEIVDFYPFLMEASVETSRNEAWTATLVFETRRDENGRWVVQDADVFVPWAEIAISAVFGEREEAVFKGYLREVNTEMPEDAGTAKVKVECQDQSLRLDRTHKRESWGSEDIPTSDDLILLTILGSYGYQASMENASGQSGIVELAQDSSDIGFLKKRAEFNGYELIFYPDEVYFGPFRYQGEPQSTVLVYAGKSTNCLSLNIDSDGHQPDAVAFDLPAEEGEDAEEVVVWPDLELMGTTAANSTAAGLEDFIWKMSGEGGASRERLEAKALAKANDIDLHRLQGQGELDGTMYSHVLQVGQPVPVDGLGDWLNGMYYVDTVKHQFSAQGYKQQFSVLRNAYGDNLDTALSAPSALASVI